MDDTCAVCAETLQWVAYGPCGHHEVCSTCIARLRFICDDHRCCLCKSESSTIFVTKALGDYTRMINNFSVFPADPTEGRVGQYWYHEGTQAFFDDLDHYKMIKATCKLLCVVCDKMDGQGNEKSKRKGNFRNIEQLKGHLFHSHKLFMCSLCLEGRKIFICEQKLYTRVQLNQHINTGDSEVDGSETERGGFMGHPMCEFCQNPFYGDNELYSHMSTEHYTCHICQRQHPGHYEYFKNYDVLEIHFRRDHFLCEDEGCLAKKFIVFTSESEIKRHNALEHGGRMSRSQRNAVLQIPTSFRFQQSVEQDRRRRGQVFRLDNSDSQLSLAIQASLESANPDRSRGTSSSAQADSNHRETNEVDSVLCSLESFATTDSEPSSQLQNSQNTPLEASSFPPLPKSTRRSRQKSRSDSEGLGKNTMAARLLQKNNVTVLNSSRAWPAAGRQPTSSMSTSSQLMTTSSFAHMPSSSSATSSMSKPAKVNEFIPYNHASLVQNRPATIHGLVSTSSGSSSRNIAGPTKVNHSTSAPNLVNRGSFDPSTSNFPPVSAAQTSKSGTSSQSLSKVEDVHTANKSLVERIRAGLEFDEDKYAAFKVISTEYRQGLIETAEYLAYVHQFGLSHLVPVLARLCPDAQKQKELLEACNGPEKSADKNSSQLKHKKSSKKGKEKIEDSGVSSFKAVLADSVLNNVRELQSRYEPSAKMVEVLSKDGYRPAKGKSKVLVVDEESGLSSSDQPQTELRSQNGSKKTGGGSKQQKKTSKFHRVRLGDNSRAAFLDLNSSDSAPDLTEEKSDGDNDNLSEKLPIRGVWQNGGGHKLVGKLAITRRDRAK